MNSIPSRLAALRSFLTDKGVQAFIIPSTDPHLSEYVAAHWQSREWISGFTGSAGTVVVTQHEAGLWTDSRYFLQAEEQLRDTGITLYKEMLPETPTILQYLCSHLNEGDAVGIDGSVFAAEEVLRMAAALGKSDIYIRSINDPMETLWRDRPALPDAPAVIYDEQYAGVSATEKISSIRLKLEEQGVQGLLLSALDEIAWTLNLRGSDVHCNPVVISYLLITTSKVHLFILPEKLTPEVKEYLRQIDVTVHPYGEISMFLKNYLHGQLLLDTAKTNYALYSAIPPIYLVTGSSPVPLMKAVRNVNEVSGLHASMERDGVALVRFLRWLEQAVPAGGETELSVTKKLHDLRAESPRYMGDSFDTIAGYGEHAAIVHYEATPETDIPLLPKGFLLLDSGAQYMDGTTDITRTIALGALTEEEKTDYTLVLKGHIALAMAVFPAGTRGAQLDVLARMPLWQHKMNFLHGTGHGVGHYLNVHEGPQSIRMNENPVALLPGMLTSNEPGVYKAGKHGVRTENLLLVVPAGEGMFGNYLRFQTVTLCPICKKGILPELLTAEERDWLNSYHQHVYKKLAPHLSSEEQVWLAEATSNL
jgi:Xaa-Pro aminopeptidase